MLKKITILHIASGDLWAGAEAQLFTLCKALNKNQSIEVIVILLNHGTLESKLIENDIKTFVLNEENQERLRQLGDALKRRPQLALVVQGNSSLEADKRAMQLQRVMEQVATARSVSVTANNPIEWLQESKNRSQLEKINKSMGLKSVSERKSEIKATDPNLVDDTLTQKIFEQMLKDIREKQTISDQDLTALADQRALSIKQYLIENGHLDSTRVSMKKADSGVLTGLTIKLKIEAL